MFQLLNLVAAVTANAIVKTAKVVSKINKCTAMKKLLLLITILYTLAVMGQIPLTEGECAQFCRSKRGPELIRCLESCPGNIEPFTQDNAY